MASIKWNWQQDDWPHFTYDNRLLKRLEDEFLHHSGLLLGSYIHINDQDQEHLLINIMSEEAIKTSEIEGEMLNRDSVQSSIRKQLGLITDHRRADPAEVGVAEMMVDHYRHFTQPLNHKQLYHWHAMLMNGRRDLGCIGHYRKHSDTMQIVSGRLDQPTVHFEAPPSKQVYKEMNRFIQWYNNSAPQGRAPLPALTRASIAHLYFESIHPFEDGNGRIGRSIAEKSIAQSINKPAMVALSQTIYKHRKQYYTMLERANKSNQIDEWLDYFATTILEAQQYSIKLIEFIIQKTKFYDQYKELLNPRQHKVTERMFFEGLDGFKGGLSAQNYLRITSTSRATATRDLQHMVSIGAFTKTGTGKGTRYYLAL